MLILAVEQSTAECSVCIVDGDDELYFDSWHVSEVRNQHLFIAVKTALDKTAISPSRIGLFAVGIGPGAFSGLRSSLSALRGMARPLGQTVTGVASPAAAAWALFEGGAPAPIHVVGDIRRGHYFLSTINSREEIVDGETSVTMIKPDELASAVKAGTIVTADWQRIGTNLVPLEHAGLRVLREPAYPDASSLAQIVRLRAMAGRILPAAAPIYMHPSVAILRTGAHA